MQKLYDEEPSADLEKNGFNVNKDYKYAISVATLSVKNKGHAKKYSKEIGEYAILNSPFLNILDKPCAEYTQRLLNKLLKEFIPSKPSSILVVGLGNQDMTADAFGSACIDYLKLKKNVYAIKPSVYSSTNILSFDIVKGICQQIQPSLVILLDSLATHNIKRLACSFQITNVGILPGGALHDLNKMISQKTLLIPCVVIGVPLMIMAKGLNAGLDEFYQDMILTPKDIEAYIKTCAKMVCSALDKTY